jgi:hypothetical protein
VLAAPLALACGQIDTAVGAELSRDAGGETIATIDAGMPHEASDAASGNDGPSCTGDLSNVGAGDFLVTWTVTTTQTGLVALVNQRRTCAPSVFWDIRMTGGLLEIEVDDVTNYTNLFTTGATINDGRPHDVAARRVSGTLTASVDGVDVGSGASLASLGALPPLASGTDVCVTSSDGTAAFVGTLANVCVASLANP